MSSYATCIRNAERILAELEADLARPGLHPLELLDLWYLRWLTQQLLRRCQARQRRQGSRRDLTPCQDRYGLRRIA